MGLVYLSSESAAFISALQKNLSSGKGSVDQLKIGSQKVISAVDGNLLAGAAYTAGKGLFSELIIPTILRTTQAIEQIEQELQTYRSADKIVASEGELDEDKLNQQMAVTNALKVSVDSTRAFMRAQSVVNPVAGVVSALLNAQQKLAEVSNNLQADLNKTKQKIAKLQAFNAQTSSLFSSSLNDLKIAMQSVLALNQSFVNLATGEYELPSTMDKSWFTELHTEAYSALKAELANENETGQGYKLFAQGALWVDNKGQLHADGSAEANAYLMNLKTQGDFEIAGIKFNGAGQSYLGAKAAAELKSSFGKQGMVITAKAEALLGRKVGANGGFEVGKGILSLRGNAKAEAIGGAFADASGKIYAGRYGLSAFGTAAAKAGAEGNASAGLNAGSGIFQAGVSGNAQTFAGAKAEANGGVGLSVNDIGLEGKAKAFVGAQASIGGDATLGYTTGGVEAGLSTGIGGELGGKLTAREGHLKLGVDIGLTAGVGAKVSASFDVNYGQQLQDIQDIGGRLNPFD